MIIYSTNPTFGPSLREISDLSCIASCLVLPGFLMDTLLSNRRRDQLQIKTKTSMWAMNIYLKKTMSEKILITL